MNPISFTGPISTMNSLTFLVVFMTLSLLSLSHFTEAFSCPARLEYGNVARFPTCGEDSSGYDVGGTVTHVHQGSSVSSIRSHQRTHSTHQPRSRWWFYSSILLSTFASHLHCFCGIYLTKSAIDAKKVAGKNDWYCTVDKSPYCCLDQAVGWFLIGRMILTLTKLFVRIAHFPSSYITERRYRVLLYSGTIVKLFNTWR